MVVLALAAYGCGCALAWVADFHMCVQIDPLVQCLDSRALRDRFWESLLYLHSQPPLLNFILGIVLKLEQAGGPSIQTSLFWMHLTMGACAAAGIGALAGRLIRPRLAAAAATLLFLFHPMFYVHTFFFFYTIHELLFLVCMALFAEQYLRRGRVRDFAGAGIFTIALVNTHTLFAPAWAMALLIGLAALNPRRRRGTGLCRLAPVAAMLIILLVAWPLKNWMIFDTFSYTSWAGYNLSHNFLGNNEHLLPDPRGIYRPEPLGPEPVRWTLDHAEFELTPRSRQLRLEYWVEHPDVGANKPVHVRMSVDHTPVVDETICSRGLQKRALTLPPLQQRCLVEFEINPTWRDGTGRELGIAIGRLSWQTTTGSLRATILMPRNVIHGIPARMQDVETLIKPFKPGGHLNFNHYWMFDYSRRGTDMALSALRRNPRLLLDKIMANYLYFTRFSGRHAYSGEYICPPGSLLWNWTRLYEALLCQDFRPESKLSETGLAHPWPISGFMLTFPLLIGLIPLKIMREWRAHPIRARLALCMYYCIAWVTLLVIVVDGLEGNRLRFSTIPFLIILGFWLLPGARGVKGQGR